MPISGVLDMQRRSLPLGEIRIGESTPGRNGGRTPVRRETFRFTTPAEETAGAIAAKLGGTPAPWDRRKGYWVVDTDVASLDVFVPPRGLAVDAWMEMWDTSKCVRRCDGITEQRTGKPCLCPQPQDRTDPAQIAAAAAERKRLAKMRPAQACSALTRINLSIPWLPGAIGVWRLSTGSANAAVETADTGEVLERARAMDVYLPAQLLIHWRPGQDGHPYPVPVLRSRASAEQIAQLPAGMDGMLAQLGGGGQLALEAAPASEGPAVEQAAAAPPAPPPAAAPASGPAKAKRPSAPTSPVSAQQVADTAAKFTTRDQVMALKDDPAVKPLLGGMVTDPAEPDGAEEELRSYLNARWSALGAPPRQEPAGTDDGHLFPSDADAPQEESQ